jgi:hypothetical protein
MSSQNTSNGAFEAVIAKQEIYDTLMRYCRAIDRCDEALLRTVYHSDATDDHGVFSGSASEFCSWVMKVVPIYRITQHCVTNVLIEVTGDNAHSEAYFWAYQRAEDGGEKRDEFVGGRYIDRFERREGHWKIAHRRVVFDWSRVTLATRDWVDEEVAKKLTFGKQDKSDPVYER